MNKTFSSNSFQSHEHAERNLFIKGLLVSLFLHAVMIGLLSLSHTKISAFSKRFKSIEVTYKSVKPLKKKKKDIVFKDLSVGKAREPEGPKKVKVLTKKEGLFSTIGSSIRDISKLSGNLLSGQKKSVKLTMLDIQRKITLPPLSSAKITNPKYITYNDGMRDAISRNIKRRAYTYVNHRDFEAGKVYLTFVLASDGALRQIQIIEDKTAANKYLRSVALKSIKESSPFPPFPIGFDYPEFTFNLLISFQD